MEWMKVQNSEFDRMECKLKARGYFELLLIGSGAFAKVYRMRDKQSRRLVACKISRASNMAEQEAVLLRGLSHPLFPEYVEDWQEEGWCYLVMEYIPGCSLQKLVDRRGNFTEEQVVRIGRELAAGLEYLHERPEPIIFRDVKPENVMIREDGRVKLVDVGCACRDSAAGRTIAGSRGYAAPEQFVLKENPGRESDVYALGKLLRFLLVANTGMEAGKGGKQRLSEKICRKRLDNILKQAVQEERWKRIPDMHTFQQLLDSCDSKRGTFALTWRKKNVAREAEFYYIQNIRKGF